ncbi:hypothetical protein IFR05_017165 [Cadophora sp. M221]|nr:hypothetical protein IFR05_017165 [Cadophora sp. M221]
MRSVYIGLGAFALSSVGAWTYPDCDPDNCYRNLADPRFTNVMIPFCVDYIAGYKIEIPPDYGNCESALALSSACSCITYSTSTSVSIATAIPTYFITSSSYVATVTTSSSFVSDTVYQELDIAYKDSRGQQLLKDLWNTNIYY